MRYFADNRFLEYDNRKAVKPAVPEAGPAHLGSSQERLFAFRSATLHVGGIIHYINKFSLRD